MGGGGGGVVGVVSQAWICGFAVVRGLGRMYRVRSCDGGCECEEIGWRGGGGGGLGEEERRRREKNN